MTSKLKIEIFLDFTTEFDDTLSMEENMKVVNYSRELFLAGIVLAAEKASNQIVQYTHLIVEQEPL